MAEYEQIEYEEENGAAIVRFDRPEKANAMTRTMLWEFIDAVKAARETRRIRAVILTGNGDYFSSGYDLGREEGTLEEFMMYVNHDHYDEIFHADLPIIAAVHGDAIAGAVNLIEHCDIAIAGDDVELGLPEVHMAGGALASLAHPYNGTSIKHMKELLFTGKMVDAAEAERMGLINRAVPADELMDEVWELVEDIKLTPPAGVEMAKAQLNHAMQQKGFTTGNKLDHYLWAMSFHFESAHEFRKIREEEGMRAALEWMNNTVKEYPGSPDSSY